MQEKILFICKGNICRSPAAEEIFRQKTVERGVSERFYVDSAGTYGYHEGELPDLRMRSHAARRGYRLTSLSRPVRPEDFENFDLILAMDDTNLAALERRAPDVSSLKKIVRLTDYCRRCVADHVPDPYYGGSSGFENVLDILEDACEGLLDELLA